MLHWHQTFRFELILCIAFLLLYSSNDLKGQERDEGRHRKVDSLTRKATELRFSHSEKALDLTQKAYRIGKQEGYLQGMVRAADIAGEIGFYYGDPERGRKKLAQADSIRERMENPKGLGRRCKELGIILQNQHHYRQADSLFRKAYRHFKKDGAVAKMGRIQYFRSQGQFFQNRYPKALKHARSALALYDSIGDKEGMATSYQQIGRIHRTQEKREKAGKAFEKAKDFYLEAGHAAGVGSAHDLLGGHYLKQEKLDSARYHYRKAIEFSEKGNDPKGKAYAKVHLAEVLFHEGRFAKSEDLTRQALKVFQRFRDPTGLIMCFKRIGKVHKEKAELDSALFYFQKALPRAERIKSFKEKSSLLKLIAETQKQMGEEGKAYTSLKKASLFEDSLAMREQKKKMAELEAKYQMRERKKKLKLKEARLREQAVRQYALMGGIGLVLLFSAFLYYQYKRKKKANIALMEKNQVIEEKNEEIIQSLNYASRIQSAVLPNKEAIKDHFGSGFVLFKPRDRVSGDLFWMEAYEGLFYVAVMDCTGHGVPGAMISILGHNGLNKAIMEKRIKDPGVSSLIWTDN